MKKRLSAIFFIVIFISTVVLIIVEGSKTEVLPIGSKIPSIQIATQTGTMSLEANFNTVTLLVYFSSDCSHCEYQLNLLNNNIDDLKEVDIYLVTTDQNYLNGDEIRNFSSLLESGNVMFGIINKDEYKSKFGSMITPSLFFLNREGKLTSKLKGETKIERILEEINKTMKHSNDTAVY